MVRYYGTALRCSTAVRYYGKVLRYDPTVRYYGTIRRYGTTVRFYGTLGSGRLYTLPSKQVRGKRVELVCWYAKIIFWLRRLPLYRLLKKQLMNSHYYGGT